MKSKAFILLALLALCVSCTQPSGDGTDTPKSGAKGITAYSFSSPSATGTITESSLAIAVTVPYGTDVTKLVATFTTTGQSVSVASAPQTSGTTANDFTKPVSYVVTAEDATTATYTVTVSVAPDPISVKKEYNLTVGTSNADNVRTELGREPNGYLWDTTTYTKDTLPTGYYCMQYLLAGSNALIVVINNTSSKHIVDELRIEGPGYSCMGGKLKRGTSLEDAITILGNPSITKDGAANEYVTDVLYKNIDGVAGKHYYKNSANGIRLFFKANNATGIYIYSGTQKISRD